MAYFIGKGDREAEQEMYAPAVKACLRYFRSVFGQTPEPEDHLFDKILS